MDKETLSNYGWIVICVMVLAVMIALATPFGSFVSEAVQSTTKGLFDVNKNALDAAGITIDDNAFVEGNGGAGENGGAGQSPVIPEPPSNPETTFTFTIAGTTYQAEEGMKWEKWVESDYNDRTWGIDDRGWIQRMSNMIFSGEWVVENQNYGSKVSSEDSIIPEHDYSTTINGGGSN